MLCHIHALTSRSAPFLGDLTFIDENPNQINGMVNFGKLRMVRTLLPSPHFLSTFSRFFFCYFSCL